MSYKVTLVGAQAHEQMPGIAVYAVNARGQAGAKIGVVRDGALSLPTERPAVIAFGPDVADAAQLDPKTLVTLRLADQLPVWDLANEILIPANWWHGWIGFQVCLSGSVSQCYPYRLGVEALRALATGQQEIVRPEGCIPVCNAVVEVWEDTTCCWPLPIYQVPVVIQKLAAFLAANPVMFPPPVPDPSPAQQLARVNAALGAGKISSMFLPDTTLAQHLAALQSLSAQDAASYIETYPSLWRFVCNTSTLSQLGETTVNPDGSFAYCYRYYPFFLFNCRHSYVYKVKQFINGNWTYIYDGIAANQYFAADDNAALHTQSGQTCYQPPSLPGKDYIALQAIGGTDTSGLYSNWAFAAGAGGTIIDQTQTGDVALTALPVDAGLTISDGAPWATQLPLLLNYDPELQNAAQAPQYYRFSVVQCGADGKPVASPVAAVPVTLHSAVSWLYFDTSTPQITIASQSLGPVTVNGNQGLFQIPYFGDGNPNWLGGQFHQVLDTTALLNVLTNSPGTGNGQFLLTLEVFDSGGNRLVPQDAGAPLGTDTVGSFNYVRLLANGTDTANVPFNSLTHVLWVDNRPVVAHIAYFMNGGSQVCQFYQESADTPFYVGFEAYHAVMCDTGPSPVPSRTFMADFSLTYQEGLGGNAGTLASGGDTNWCVTCAVSVANAISTASPPAATPPFNVPVTTFGETLSPQTACAFAINLGVASKHTNGSGPVYGYWANQPSAVALADVAFCQGFGNVVNPNGNVSQLA